MPTLLVVGAGLFGSQAAAYARSKGYEALVFDPGLAEAASPAAAGLFKEEWAGKRWQEHYRHALPILDRLYGIKQVRLCRDDGVNETFLCVPPTAILEPSPIRQVVTSVGDGWLEAGGQRYEGYVYVAAGVWCTRFLPGLAVVGKAGSSFIFQGERAGRIRDVAHGRQAIAFVRDPGITYFSDGTAERDYTPEHERQTLDRAAEFGLTGSPILRHHGLRPYTPGGPVFRKVRNRTWLATGGRKMGTIFGAYYARRLVEEEMR
jgi:glycine/D-amino acid oxidase-like deaminating enzyme